MVITPDCEEFFSHNMRSCRISHTIAIIHRYCFLTRKRLYGLVIRIPKLSVMLIFCYINFDVGVLSSDIDV